jgi:hypothetical protein
VPGWDLRGQYGAPQYRAKERNKRALMDLLAKPLPETVEVQAIIINTVWKAKVANLKLTPVKDSS